MGESGLVRFHGNLDPSAQEFWPAQNAVCQPQIPLFRPSQLFYPYAAPPPVSLCDGGVAQFLTAVPVPAPAPMAYVTASMVIAPQPPLPPPTAAATRALLLTLVPCDVSESKVRKELEVFGEVRGLQMERVGEGIVTVHFYDLRHAERALKEIREQHMQQQARVGNQYVAAAAAGCEPGAMDPCAPLPSERGLISGRAVWAHFIIPASNDVPNGNNQGTVVVFNLDPSVSTSALKDIFQAYGPVKELRETPLKKHQKFVEFYDVRDAAKALKEMNGKEINGKQVVIEFSRPGGYNRKFFNANNGNNIKAFTACIDNKSLTTSKYNHHSRNSNYPSSPTLPPSPPSLPRKFAGRHPPNIPPRSFLSRSQSPTKNVSNSSKGNPNGNHNSKISFDTSTVVGGGDVKKTAKKNQNNPSRQRSRNGIKQQLCKGRTWKGGQAKKFDPRFLISEDAMAESNCKDSRTTVMIRNIPNKYSQKLLLNMLDNHCIHCNEQIADRDDQPLSSYDFVYLPIDFNNKCNVGYGFVNMTSPEATWRLYKAFHHQHWEVFNSRKICEVTYARVQGLQPLKEHFRNSKFPCEMDHYLPVVFEPPRDGKQLTEPLPIVGQTPKHRPIISGPSPKANEEEEEEEEEGEDDDDHSLGEGRNENLLGGDGGSSANSCRENNGNNTNHFNYCDSDDTVDHHEQQPSVTAPAEGQTAAMLAPEQ